MHNQMLSPFLYQLNHLALTFNSDSIVFLFNEYVTVSSQAKKNMRIMSFHDRADH